MAVFYVLINQQLENLSVTWQRNRTQTHTLMIYPKIDGLACCLLTIKSKLNKKLGFTQNYEWAHYKKECPSNE